MRKMMSKSRYFSEVLTWFRHKAKDIPMITTCMICGGKSPDKPDNFTDYNIIHCPSCGFVWNATQPTQEILDEFYTHSNAMTQWSKIKNTPEETRRQESKFFPVWKFIHDQEIKSVLDVGCGNGYFLNHCQLGLDRCGVEMNRDARLNCEFPVYNSFDTFKDSLHSKKKFQLITMFGVLEHLKNPLKEVEKYSESLTDDGLFGIIVPNVDSMVVRMLQEQCCTFCPQHLWYYKIETLEKLMEKASLKLGFYFTLESEIQPILRKLRGFDPYYNCPIELTDRDITDRAIIHNNLGYKIVAFFKKNK